jgi:hypothetical protein
MNERIKELALQSGAEFWQRLENDTVNPEAYITFDPPDSLEKFAELIVRECILKVENEASTYAEPVWAFELINDIREHFGVEE